ncbi:MAG: M48 family peptidase [Alphaproteobacteria bacterium]|nr:MAG: M48 family peptidase [Alphaproteobacteria bacterium]
MAGHSRYDADETERRLGVLVRELDLALPLVLRRRRGLDRLSLRVDPARRCILLHAPRHCAFARLADFLVSRRDFLAERVADLPPPRPFAPGGAIPFEGHLRRIRHEPAMARQVVIDDDAILVGGPLAHLASRLARGLRQEAHERLRASVERHAAGLGLTPAGIRVADTVSRWGSCATDGTLRFNWRLVLAPAFVLDYVAAHEVAHLRHPHHGPAFWDEVVRCAVEAKAARCFLRHNGPELFAVGAER